MFYDVLMEKSAYREGNYHSRYLSERQRNKAFDKANKRRAKRKIGLNTSRKAGAIAGGIIGGIGGKVIGARKGIAGAAIGGGVGALLGGGLGYGLGAIGDNARDSRTREAKAILKMSPKKRRNLLDAKRARRLEMEDRARREEERAHRAAIQREIRNLKYRR